MNTYIYSGKEKKINTMHPCVYKLTVLINYPEEFLQYLTKQPTEFDEKEYILLRAIQI